MSYRYMRVIVMFDLPVLSSSQIREYVGKDSYRYNKFRKFLIKSGFLMMQESIYCKLALNATVVDGIVSNVKKNKPPQGLVQILTLTEKQYSKMEIIVGENTNSTLDDDRRLIVL